MAIIKPDSIRLYVKINGKLKKSDVVFPKKPNAGANAFPFLPNGIYKSWRRYGKLTLWRCKLYSPVNHKWPNQLAWQSVYADAVSAWKSLTYDQQQTYRVKAYGKHMTGYNVFMKEYLKTHSPSPTVPDFLKQEESGYIRQQNGGKIQLQS